MKRIISLILAMLMILSISAPVLASDESGEDVPVMEAPAEPEETAESENTPAPEVTPEAAAPAPEETISAEAERLRSTPTAWSKISQRHSINLFPLPSLRYILS